MLEKVVVLLAVAGGILARDVLENLCSNIKHQKSSSAAPLLRHSKTAADGRISPVMFYMFYV